MIFTICIVLIVLSVSIKRKRYSFEREYKKCESPIEQLLMKALYKEGFKPYTQVSCGKYRIDIALYYKGKKIAIECDGKQYHSTPKQKEHDRIKDEVLRKNRWLVYRFTGKEIFNHTMRCVERIKKS